MKLSTLSIALGATLQSSSILAANIWYPDWSGGSGTCIKVDDADAPADIVNNNHYETDPEDCCERFYGFGTLSVCDCLEDTTDATACVGTGDWYVNYEGQKCVRDCKEGSDDYCGGLAPGDVDLYDADTGLEECCGEKLEWMSPWKCQANSLGETHFGSPAWYVDYPNGKCVIDCTPTSAAADPGFGMFAGLCGGIVEDGYTDRFEFDVESEADFLDALDACCAAKLPGMDADQCACLSMPASAFEYQYGCPGTTDWHVADTMSGHCVMDADPDAPSLGGPPPERKRERALETTERRLLNPCGVFFDCELADKDTKLYADPGVCCSTAFPWVPTSYCESRSNGYTSDDWYVDYSAGICKQDCDPEDGDACELPSTIPNALHADAADCCAAHLGYLDSEICETASLAGEGNYEGTGIWYAGPDNKCVLDCPSGSDDNCGGVTGGYDTLFDTPQLCCQSKYSWQDAELCAARSVGGYTNKFYKTYQNGGECVQDCASGPGCAGNPQDLSVDLYDDAEACCETMGWMNANYCVAEAEGGELTGTNMWYNAIDGENYCVLDCATGDGALCGGINQGGAALYDDAGSCCLGQFNWINVDLCEAISENAYTGGYYVDWSDGGKCVQHCESGDGPPCGDHPEDLSVALYTDEDDCCDNGLPWIHKNTCVAVATGSALTGTGDWYASTSSGKNHCVQDCPTAADSPCGGVLEGSETLFETPLECCQTKFNWYDNELCEDMTLGTHSGRWYLASTNDKCVSDCDPEDGPECDGYPSDLSATFYDDAEACCVAKVPWAKESCYYESTGGLLSEPELYVNWQLMKCVYSCPEELDPSCGGFHTGGDTYTSEETCCARISWVKESECLLAGP